MCIRDSLIAALKLIVDLWKREYQNRNAIEIAERGAKLYDKFVGFINNLEKIGKNLEPVSYTHLVIVVDDEDRENEGDLVIAAECITPEKVNFMETHARGLICAPITKERAEELELPMMVTHNTSIHSTPVSYTHLDVYKRQASFHLAGFADDVREPGRKPGAAGH